MYKVRENSTFGSLGFYRSLQADPWPNELPENSGNVPTFYHSRQTPATATRQLDFVFASEALVDRIQVRALNRSEEWSPSDHCQVEFDLN